MNWSSVRKGLLAGALVLGLCFSQIAPAAATILDYTLTGTGSYFLTGSGETGGTFTITWVGDTTNIFGAPAQLLIVPPGSINLTPFVPSPSNPVYNGSFAEGAELTNPAPSTLNGFASILTTPDGGSFGALVEFSPTGIDLSAPFNVTTPPINTGDAGSFLLLGNLFKLADGQDFLLQTLDSSDLTYSATIAATPLPSTWLMLLSGFVGLCFFAYSGTKKYSAVLAA